MNDLVLWIAALPAFVIYAAIGGLAGALGALVATLLKSRFEKSIRILPILFVIISTQITPSFVLPKLDQLSFEAAFMEAIGEIPRKIDEITILQSAGIYGNAANYNYKLTVDLDDIEDARLSILDMLGSNPDCKKLTGSLGKYISKIIYRYETNLGLITVDLKPQDCH